MATPASNAQLVPVVHKVDVAAASDDVPVFPRETGYLEFPTDGASFSIASLCVFLLGRFIVCALVPVATLYIPLPPIDDQDMSKTYLLTLFVFPLMLTVKVSFVLDDQ